MTSTIAGSTREECSICWEDYKENEIKDVDKTIQLVCGHIFHITCYEENIEHQEKTAKEKGKGQIDIRCCYCKQVNVPKRKDRSPYYSNETFQRELDIVAKEYGYEDEITEVFPYLDNIRDQLLNEHKQVSERSKSERLAAIERYKSYCNTLIEEELKPIILAILQDEIFSLMLQLDFFYQDSFFVGKGSFAISDHKKFELWVQEIQQSYNNDEDEKISLCLYKLYPSLCNLFRSATDHSRGLEGTLIMSPASLLTNRMMPERFHSRALKILKAVFTGDLALRTVREQAERWQGRGVPDAIKKHGTLVTYSRSRDKYRDLQVRISGEQLEHEINRIKAAQQSAALKNEKMMLKRTPRTSEEIAAFAIACGTLAAGVLITQAFRKIFRQ